MKGGEEKKKSASKLVPTPPPPVNVPVPKYVTERVGGGERKKKSEFLAVLALPRVFGGGGGETIRSREREVGGKKLLNLEKSQSHLLTLFLTRRNPRNKEGEKNRSIGAACLLPPATN